MKPLVTTLLIKNDGLGDLVLSSGLIADLAAALHPLELITCSQNREVAEAIPGLVKIHYVSRDSLKYQQHLLQLGIPWDKATAGDKRVLRMLETRKFGIAICLRRFIRQSSLRLMTAVKADQKVCAWQFPTNCSEQFAQKMAEGWKHWCGPDAVLSELEYFRAFISEELGLDSKTPPKLRFPASDRWPSGTPEVGLAIGGASANWPGRYWLSLAKRFVERGYRVRLYGGPDAVKTARRMVRTVKGLNDHTGKLTLEEAVSHLCGLSLLIGNDTGFTHFSCLYARKVLIILGGGTFRRFFPWPEHSNQHIAYSSMDCFDCNWRCKFLTRRCLTSISVLDVYKFAEQILKDDAPLAKNVNPKCHGYHLAWRFNTQTQPRGVGNGKI
jgi:ADP-heptose:LPS heptosyltransferase